MALTRRKNAFPTTLQFAAGYTLLELMMVLVIAGVLYFIALPAYEYALLKSTRAVARAILFDVTARQEQYFINHKRYATSIASLGLPQPYYISPQAEAVQEAAAAYRVDLEVDAGAYVGVKAIPLNRQVADSNCMTFRLSRIGVRTVSGTQAGSPATCW